MKKKIRISKEQCGFELKNLLDITRVDVIDESVLEIEVEVKDG